MKEERIYLDHNATTRPDPEVKALMDDLMDRRYGNPSAIHREGREAKAAIEEARKKVARLLGCTARRIVFTGGGSEANNQVIKSLALANWNGRKRLITSSIEHPSVLSVGDWLRKYGFNVTCLAVDSFGRVRPEELEQAITDDTFLVSIMTANNETGSLQPSRSWPGLPAGEGCFSIPMPCRPSGRFLSMWRRWISISSPCQATSFMDPKGWVPCMYGKGLSWNP